jgi:hypothetical protein
MQLSVDNLTLNWLAGASNVLLQGTNVCGNSQKAYGKWQYTVRCTANQGGSGGQVTWAHFGISKKHRWSIGRLGMATYDYCISFRDGDTEITYKTNSATDTTLYSGAGSSNDIGDYITILVDFDAGKIWFAVNGTVVEGNPNAGTGESFSFTPNYAFCPCATLTRNGGSTPGTYVLEQTLIYSTWPSFDLWDDADEIGLDDELQYDVNHADTSLIWIAEGVANGTTSLIDSSPDAHTITNNLATVASSTDVLNSLQEPCGSGSLTFDGNDAFTITPVTEFVGGTGNITIEYYIKRASNPASSETIYDNRNSATSTLILTLFVNTSGQIVVFYSGANRITSITSVCDNQWHHFALVRNGNNMDMFIDGVKQSTVAGWSGLSLAANAFRIGSNYVPSQYFTGSLNFIRVTKGIARYTSSFRPPRFWLSS